MREHVVSCGENPHARVEVEKHMEIKRSKPNSCIDEVSYEAGRR
jgi:hypothetical protein